MQPGVPVEDVFKQVRSAVRRASNNQQTPWENTALEGQFYFRPALAVAAVQPGAVAAGGAGTAATTDAVSVELAYWDAVKNSRNADELRSYLAQYPNGRFALLAQVRSQSLLSPVPSASVSGSTPAPKLAAATPRSAWPTRGVVGTLVTTDRYTKITTSVDVTADDFDPERIVYSTGDVVDHQGRVIQALIGNVVAKVTSGALWAIPVKADTSGEARVEVSVGFHTSANPVGRITWSAKDLGQNRIQILADIQYGGWFGKWQATYFAGSPLPASFSSVVRGGNSHFIAQENVVSAEFLSRN